LEAQPSQINQDSISSMRALFKNKNNEKDFKNSFLVIDSRDFVRTAVTCHESVYS
jgi:hypothetical protein